MGDFAAALLVKTDSKSRVEKALDALATRNGLVPARADEPADREIFIAHAAGGWLVVLDTLFLSGEALGAAANAVSSEAPAVAYFLYDGDTTTLTLHLDGKPATSVSTGENGKVVRSPEWERALGIPGEPFFDALTERLHEADTIDALAPLLGFAPSALHEKSGKPLRFRHRAPPAWAVPAAGPARFDTKPGVTALDTRRVGEPYRTTIQARNRGGAFRELAIEISGDAVERGLVEAEAVSAEVGTARKTYLRVELAPGQTSVVLDTVDVPAGRVALPTDADTREHGHPAWEAFHAASFSVTVHVAPRAVGEGTLRVTCTAPGGAVLTSETALTITPFVWRPLRAPSDKHMPSFDVLDDESLLSAVVVYACEMDVAEQHAQELFAIVEPPEKRPVTSINPFAPRAPLTASAVFGAPIVGSDPSSPTAMVSTPARAARDALHAAIDRAFRRGIVLQATLITWGLAPTIIKTPYEWSVGIVGSNLTRTSWVSRFVRVVGEDTLWLGPPLAKRLPPSARAALPACAELDSGALVIEVGGRANRPAVEKALESLLPSSKDYYGSTTR